MLAKLKSGCGVESISDPWDNKAPLIIKCS